MARKLPPYIFVETPAQWATCVSALQMAPQLAIDLESNGLFAYQEKICLIQISTRDQDYIVDPLAPLDWTPLGEIIESYEIEKIFHAAEYDMILMKWQHDWNLNNLFDTMWAARILGYEKLGLANMLDELYGIEISKHYQRADWCQRPLPAKQLIYAQTDTHYLFDMRDDLSTELEEQGSLEESAEIFAEHTHIKIPDKTFSPDSFWSISGVKDLSPRGRAILRELNIFRDTEAQQKNRPPFKIFGNRIMLEIAAQQPNHVKQLSKIPGFSPRQIKRYGWPLIRAVQRGLNCPTPKRPRRKRLPEPLLRRYDKLFHWRRDKADIRSVSSDVVMTRDMMWKIAEANPRSVEELAQVPCFGAWRLETYSAEILAILCND